MWTRESIKIIGNNNRHIKNRIFKHEDKTDLLTIIVAGFGYTMDAPYIYYSKYIPYQLNSDVLLIDLDYSQINEFIELPDDKQDEWFEKDLIGIKKGINNLSNYSRLWQIGKSLGTSVIFNLLKEEEIIKKTEKVVWLTPGTQAKEIYSIISDTPIYSFVVYGSKDPYTKSDQIERLRSADNITIFTVQEGDHTLETDDIVESLEYLKTYVKELKGFLSNDALKYIRVL